MTPFGWGLVVGFMLGLGTCILLAVFHEMGRQAERKEQGAD